MITESDNEIFETVSNTSRQIELLGWVRYAPNWFTHKNDATRNILLQVDSLDKLDCLFYNGCIYNCKDIVTLNEYMKELKLC